MLWHRTISPLFHMNWALLGPELDELEVVLHAHSMLLQAFLVQLAAPMCRCDDYAWYPHHCLLCYESRSDEGLWLGSMGFCWCALTKIGFPKTVIDWIMVCVTSCQFSININGELVGYFQGGRGLRQGDPLSPYVFILCMEILSGLFRKMSDNQNFKFHWRCNKDRNVLTKFQELSDPYPNPNKSDIFLSGLLDSYYWV